MKLIVRNYVINTDTENVKDLLDLLEEYKIRAYNYKVSYVRGKVSLRTLTSDNVIVSIENLSLCEARDLLNKIKPTESKYIIEFHNVFYEQIIEELSKLNYPPSETKFDVFKDFLLGTSSGFRFYDRLELKGVKALSKEFENVRRMFTPFNIGWLDEAKNVLCFVALKYYGIRNNEFAKKVTNCEIYENYIKVGEFLIHKGGKVTMGGREIKKQVLYSSLPSL